MRLYRAQLADSRWLYPLARLDRHTYEGAEYCRPDPTGAPFLLAEPDADIRVLTPGRLELIGWRRVSIAKLHVVGPEYVAVADWEAEFGAPASSDDGSWHELIQNGLYVKVHSEPEPDRLPFDTSVYADAPFDLTEPPEPDLHPEWDFQPSIAYAVFGPVYAHLLPGAVTGLLAALVEALSPLPGVSDLAIAGERVTGTLSLPYEDNRRITARLPGQMRKVRLAMLKSPFKIPFANHVAGENKADAVAAAQEAVAAAVATLPVEMAVCARCSGLGVVPSFVTPAQRRRVRHPVLDPPLDS